MSARIALISLYDHHASEYRSLHAVLKKNGFETFLIFYRFFGFKMGSASQEELGILTALLKDLCADVALVNVPSSLAREAERITEAIRDGLRKPVAWTGFHPTVRPHDCLKTADYVFRGETEEGLLEFAGSLGKDPEPNIPGLWYKGYDGVRDGSAPRIVEELDGLPLPDFSDDGKYYIEDNTLLCGDPVYNQANFYKFYKCNYRTSASRMCRYDCSYCWTNALKAASDNDGSYLRRRSPGSVVRELAYAKERLNAEKIIFQDSCFPADSDWVEEFRDLYKDQVCLPFYCEIHPELINEKLITALCAAGLDSTMIGIQSGSESVRKRYFNRHISNDQILDRVRLLQRYPITVHYEIITDNPYETEESRREGLTFLLSLPRPLRLNVFSLNFFPDTAITRRALEDGLIREDEIEGRSARGMRQFILKNPGDGKDLFWNHIYFLSSDLFCASGSTAGLRGLASDRFILFLSRSSFLKNHPSILAKAAGALSSAVTVKRRLRRLFENRRGQKIGFFTRVRLLLEVAAAFILIPALVRFIDFRRLLIILDSGRSRAKKKQPAPEQIDFIVRCAGFIMGHRPLRKFKNPCLIRSAGLYRLLGRYNMDVRIHFGVRKNGDTLAGHSWITLDGKPFFENPDTCKTFNEIYSYPSR